MPGAKTKEGYDFAVIDIEIDGKGNGSGTLAPAARPELNQDALTVEDFRRRGRAADGSQEDDVRGRKRNEGKTIMSNLIVIGFDNAADAFEMRGALARCRRSP